MFGWASTCVLGVVNGIKGTNQSSQWMQILTAISALFIPPPNKLSLRISCDLLGLNHQSKYTKKGLDNWVAYDKYLMLNGDVDVGEMVRCQDGEGVLKTINLKDDSITITLHPWECDVTYQSSSRARMQWYESNLMEWKKKRRSDIASSFYSYHWSIPPKTQPSFTKRQGSTMSASSWLSTAENVRSATWSRRVCSECSVVQPMRHWLFSWVYRW